MEEEVLNVEESARSEVVEVTDSDLLEAYDEWHQDGGDDQFTMRSGTVTTKLIWPFLKHKVLVKNCTKSPAVFLVDSIPSYVTVKYDAGVGVRLSGIDLKVAVDKKLAEFRAEQKIPVEAGSVKACYIGADSDYAYVRVQGDADYQQLAPNQSEVSYRSDGV